MLQLNVHKRDTSGPWFQCELMSESQGQSHSLMPHWWVICEILKKILKFSVTWAMLRKRTNWASKYLGAHTQNAEMALNTQISGKAHELGNFLNNPILVTFIGNAT